MGVVFTPSSRSAPASPELRGMVTARIESEFSGIEAILKNLHAHPELSFREENTAAFLAGQLRVLGFEVTEKVGNTGVVGVFKNGSGPTVLVRTDMDGLPVKEATGLPYASNALQNDLSGKEQPTMHACGHDLHMTGFVGSARTLVALKDHWAGTLVFVAQPAEEIAAGARAMLADGLYTRFPKPDYALALHVISTRPAGVIGYTEGPILASVDSVDIVVRGVGGHGSHPHLTKDPVVLASQIVVALQTIVSREVKPGDTAVVTVGTIHGGTKRNIIPEEVKLELTLRSFDEKVMEHLVASIRRITFGVAQAAGIPEDRMPVVSILPESVPVTINDTELTRRLVGTFKTWFAADRLEARPPTTGGEDFSEYGRTKDRVPTCFWWVGAADPKAFAESERTGVSLAYNHSPTAVFVPDPTLKACVASMTAAVLELTRRK